MLGQTVPRTGSSNREDPNTDGTDVYNGQSATEIRVYHLRPKSMTLMAECLHSAV